MEMKGREITVKWAGEGMWTCLDPACNKKNHEVGFCVLKKQFFLLKKKVKFQYVDTCVQCKLPHKTDKAKGSISAKA